MSEEAQEEPIWTYTNEDGRYDAALLTDPGKQAFQLLLEVNAEIQTLGKKTAVLQAAAAQLNGVIQRGLTEDALLEDVENDDESSETKED